MKTLNLQLIKLLALILVILIAGPAFADISADMAKLKADREKIIAGMTAAAEKGDNDEYNALKEKLEPLDKRLLELNEQLRLQAEAKNQGAKAIRQFNEGNQHLKAGRYQEAVNSYIASIAVDATNPNVFYNMAFAHIQLRQNEEATVALTKATTIKPDYADAFYLLGKLSESGSDANVARDYYNKALAIDSTQFKAHYGIGTTYYRQKNYPEAENSFRKAIAINPKYGDALVNLGRVYLDTKKDAEAIDMFKQAGVADPKNVFAYQFLATALNGTQKYADALEAADKALKIKNNNAAAWYEKGFALFSLGRKKDSIPAFEKAKTDRNWRDISEHYINEAKGIKKK